METIITCIEGLRSKLDKFRRTGLKEYPTRTILIDPLLKVLGWDVRDPEEVELEYPTIDGKSVDYAPKINHKPVLFIEAKPLNDPLVDVKAITQVVGYAANAGVEWCVLTNGITYKVYRSTEKAEAPEKLLFETSIDSKETKGMSIKQVAEQLARFSRDAMAKGLLDEIGEQVFTTGKVRKALEKLFIDPPNSLIKLIRVKTKDDSITPMQVKESLRRLWPKSPTDEYLPNYKFERKPSVKFETQGKKYDEKYHLEEKPQEVVELFKKADQYCVDLYPAGVERSYLAKYIKYSCVKNIFCCVHLQKSGLRIWLKVNYLELNNPPEYVRDVSRVGHWGVGDVELMVNNIERFHTVKDLIKKSFEQNCKTQF